MYLQQTPTPYRYKPISQGELPVKEGYHPVFDHYEETDAEIVMKYRLEKDEDPEVFE